MTQNVLDSNGLGDRIRVARNEAGVSIADIARALDVDPRTVNRWQAGKVTPSVMRLGQIAALLGKPVAYFLAEAAA